MNTDSNPTSGLDAFPPPPPPPPPPSAPAARRRGLSSRAATAAVAGGLVVGGIAGGYVITQAASPSPSATPSSGSAPASGWHRGPGFAGAGFAARTQDLQQVASVIGITTAQLQTEMSSGKTIAAIATEHNVATATVISTLVADETTEINAAVTSGQVTAAQAAQMKTQTTQRVTDMVNGTRPAGGPCGPHGFGPAGNAEDQQVIATAIGITTTQLQTELAAGKTIAAVAVEHHVTAAAVISALVASENAEVDARVSSGQITAAQGTQEKSQTTQRVTDEVNGTRPAFRPRGGPWGGPPPAGTAPAG